MRLYNVTVRVVGLVWAESEAEAIEILGDELVGRGFSLVGDGDNAFVSEPVESMGWAGA